MLSEYFPPWQKLTQAERDLIQTHVQDQTVSAGTLLHRSTEDCAGLIIVRQGQLRAYITSEDGKQVTLYRLFERDICLFSASCMFSEIQFDITIEAQKDTQFWVIPTPIYQQLMQGIGLDGGSVGILVALYSMILGPIAEELTFRGLTLGYGRRAVPFWMANVTQAFLFAALHMNPLQSIYTFFFGLMLGYVVYRSGSLILGVVVHIVFNSVGVLFPQIVVMGNSPITFFLFLLLGMVLTYAGLILIGKCSPTGEERIGQK